MTALRRLLLGALLAALPGCGGFDDFFCRSFTFGLADCDDLFGDEDPVPPPAAAHAVLSGAGEGLALAGTRALVLDGAALVEVDLATGARTHLLDLAAPEDLAAAGGRAWVLDAGALLEIDLATRGVRRVAEDLAGALAVDAPGHAYVARPGELVAVDLATGERRAVGTALLDPRDLAVAEGRAFVLDAARRALVEVDLATGGVRTLSDLVTGGGPPLAAPRLLAVGPGMAFVADGGRVLAVDLDTGDRADLAVSDVRGLAYDAAAGGLVVLVP